VTEACVGKNMVLKRFHARARGRGARVEKPFSQITIVVEEKREEKSKPSRPAKGRSRRQTAKPAQPAEETA